MPSAPLEPAVARTIERIRDEYPPLLSTAETAKILNVTTQTVRSMIDGGDLPASRIRKDYRIYLESVIEILVDNLTTGTPRARSTKR